MENQKDNKKKTEDEVWDEELNDPENSVFFEHLDQQIEDALANGDFIEDGEVPDSE